MGVESGNPDRLVVEDRDVETDGEPERGRLR